MTQSAAAISPLNLFHSFVSDVEGGRIASNKLIKQAVKRHQKDVKASKTGLYRFDEAEAARVLDLFALFRHTKGEYAKQHFNLLPWQAFLIGSLYGWRKKSDGTRRYTRAYVEVARKNGKTEVAAGIGLIEAFFNGEYGAEVYSAANKLDQASICWKSGVTMAKFLQKDVEEIAYLFEVHESFNNRRIFARSNNSFFAPVASDSKTLDGLNPQCAIIDEYHEAQDDSMLRVMETGMGSRREPLVFIITTAGFNRNGPCYQLRRVVTDILEGKKRDESFFGLVFTLDEGDNWEDETTWQKANPSLGLTPSLDFMRRECLKAKNEGETSRINFLTKNLNVWTTTQSTWIKDEDWMANATMDADALKGRTCYAGLDLASVRDITALVLIFPPPGEGVTYVLPYFWVPQDGAEERAKRDGVPYLQWIADGTMTATPGNVTDYAFVKADIMEIAETYKPVSIAYDRFNASQLVIELQDEGLKMEPYGQGFVSMSAPTRQIEKMVLSRELGHGGNEPLRWMCGNIQVKMDPAGNIKMDKAKSREKIDGMVSLAMAIGEWMSGEKPKGPSKYESEELTVV